MATEIKNKSEFVRGVLKDIGALVETPPTDWREKVQAALKKQGLGMHNVMVYAVRRETMKKLAKGENGKAKKAEKPEKPKVELAVKERTASTPGRKPKAAQPKSELSVSDLITVQKFADQFGGAGKLTEALAALQLFK